MYAVFFSATMISARTLIEHDALPSEETDVEQGIIRKIMIMNMESSTLVSNGTAYAIDPLIAGVMLIWHDMTVKEWSDPKADQYDLNASTWFGLGILRSIRRPEFEK